ncbi:MAG TPA: LysM domain-containing protein [Patescibacteria group bacterium]|nr:LysM domain-containing protein [Patescibacteria group bacterium]
MIERPTTPPAGPVPADVALAACPHLVSVDGAWHGTAPSRAHRCRLLVSGRPTLDRQRAHCLTPAHSACPTWLEVHGDEGPRRRPGPFVPMAPVVLEGAGMGLPSEAAARRLVAPATVVVVGLALGALALARGPLAPGLSGAGDNGPSPTPPGTIAPATPAPTPRPAPTATPTPRPAPTAAPTPRPATYTVRSGDTLSAIAARFGTTVAEVAALNNIANPSLIRVGQVLQLP